MAMDGRPLGGILDCNFHCTRSKLWIITTDRIGRSWRAAESKIETVCQICHTTNPVSRAYVLEPHVDAISQVGNREHHA